MKKEELEKVIKNMSKDFIIYGDKANTLKERVIRFRKIDSEEIIEYFVSSEKMEVIDIPVGYTHNIENLGDTDMVTVMWANEVFNKEKPDTYFLEV